MLKLTLILPNNYNSGDPIEVAVKEQFEKDLIAITGGFTSHQSTGKWIDSNGVVVSDESTTYSILFKNEKVYELDDLCDKIKAELGQDVLCYDIVKPLFAPQL